MTWLGTILLAVAVGAAEIFPVSGSGHFYILEKLLGLELSAADRTACLAVLNGGAALALLIFYHRRAGEMLVHALAGLGLIRPAARRRAPSLPRRQLQLLLLASLPMLGALLLRRPRLFVENHEAALAFVCLLEAVSGVLIYFAGRGARGKRDLRQMTASDGLALGCAQMENIEKILENKRRTAMAYREFFAGSGIKFFDEPEGCKSNFWLNAVLLPDRAAQQKFLGETNGAGVQTRPIWELMNRLEMFRSCPHGELRTAEMLADRVVNIPSGYAEPLAAWCTPCSGMVYGLQTINRTVSRPSTGWAKKSTVRTLFPTNTCIAVTVMLRYPHAAELYAETGSLEGGRGQEAPHPVGGQAGRQDLAPEGVREVIF